MTTGSGYPVGTWKRAKEHYARAAEQRGGVPVAGVPDDWYLLRVIDLNTGEIVKGVIEVNSAIGWVRQMVLTDDGKGWEYDLDTNGMPVAVKVRRVQGLFRIERCEPYGED